MQGWTITLSPNSEENGISFYITTTSSNIQVMRIKEVITKDKMSLDIYRDWEGRAPCAYGA